MEEERHADHEYEEPRARRECSKYLQEMASEQFELALECIREKLTFSPQDFRILLL